MSKITADSTGSTRLGSTIRRLRRENGLTQARMAERLGISASYLNLIENNQRNVTATLLLKLAEGFGLQLADLAADDDSQLLADLMEMFGDPVFEAHDVRTTDVRDLVSANSGVARAVLALYDAHRKAQSDLTTLAERVSAEDGNPLAIERPDLPADLVSDFLQANSNYFPELEEIAQRVLEDAKLPIGDPFRAMLVHLEQRCGVRVAILPPAARHGTVRRYDPVARTLVLSEMLSPSSRNFQIAQQIGLITASEAINTLLDKAGVSDNEARAVGRGALASYFAGALLMPYEPFLETAKLVRYDIEMLEHHFGTSFEQVCHRLTTMQRPGLKGIPFHMLRVDIAGNISKRFSLSGFRFPRHGGACPRLNVYSAFMTPGQIHVQTSRMPNGSTFFCIASTVRKRGGGFGLPESYYSIGLGCDVAHARDMVYADGIDLDNPAKANPIGTACRICERMDCRQRAFPPIHHRLNIDENVRGLSAYVSPR
ncbi:MAG: XRE family transcriptional regulator [Rhodospirillaceae bacterium]|nr:XRE family transcriptional regulator [Rhodospirillaceae bacterium]